MEEGTVPVHRYRPCAESDDDVVPVQELSHLRGSTKLRGWNPRCAFGFFLNTSPELKKCDSYWSVSTWITPIFLIFHLSKSSLFNNILGGLTPATVLSSHMISAENRVRVVCNFWCDQGFVQSHLSLMRGYNSGTCEVHLRFKNQ